MKIAICIGTHTVVSSVVNLLDVLHGANRMRQREGHAALFETRLLSHTTEPIGQHGVLLQAQAGLRAAQHCDLVLVPAFRAQLEDALSDQAALLRLLPQCAARGQRLGSACAGALLLAASGALDGHRATTHWSVLPHARQAYPQVQWQMDALVEADATHITSGGGTASIDLGLALVEEQGGADLAQQVAANMLFDYRRGPQSQYFPLAPIAPLQDPLAAQVQQRLQQALQQPPSVAQLADHLHVTPRTLLRRFKAATGLTVQGYLQRLRLDAARRMFDEQPIPVEQAMSAVGYTDRASFSRGFKRHFGVAPGAFRQRRVAVM